MPGWLVFLLVFAAYLVLMRWCCPPWSPDLDTSIVQRRVSTRH
jgi:hypothetical protein